MLSGRLYRASVLRQQYVHLVMRVPYGRTSEVGMTDGFTEENPSRELSVAGQLLPFPARLAFQRYPSASLLGYSPDLYRITDGSGERVKGNKLLAELYLSTGDVLISNLY